MGAIAIFKRLRKWEKDYALTFVGCLITFLAIPITLAWPSFFGDSKPRLHVKILSNANVFDIKEDVSKLEVKYDGVNLRETKQALSLLTLKFLNDGGSSILLNYYDTNDPVGLRLNAEIKTAEVLQGSKEYFSNHLHVTYTNSLALLSPVIMNAGDWFVLKMLALHKEGIPVTIKAIGTIAYIGDITLTAESEEQVKSPNWFRGFGGILILAEIVLLFYLTLKVFKKQQTMFLHQMKSDSEEHLRKLSELSKQPYDLNKPKQ